jgi:hypothetical protein
MHEAVVKTTSLMLAIPAAYAMNNSSLVAKHAERSALSADD